MKRWLPLVVLAAGLGVGGVVLWPYLVAPKSPPVLSVQNGKPPVKGVVDDPGFDPSVQKLLLEFDAHLNEQPWPASRRLMVELALVKPKGLDFVIEAWLRRMHEAKLGDTTEFRELAGAWFTVNPSAPQQLVAEANRQDLVVDLAYDVEMLLAFGKSSVPVVIGGLAAAQGNVQEAGSVLPLVLAKIGPAAVPQLREAVSHANPVVRRQAIRTLALLGGDTAGSARAEMEIALADKDAGVRTLAALAFSELGDFAAPPPVGLSAALQDVDAVVRLAAARSLVRYPAYDRKQLADILVGMLKGSQDNFVRVGWNVPVDNKRSAAESKSGLSYYPMYWEETAADVLIELGPKYQPSPETVVAMLQACPHDGRHLVHVLAMQGDAAKQVVPQLAGMVKDKDSRQRRKALLALGRLGLPRVAEAMPEIRAALKHGDGRTRWRAVLALALLEPAAVKQTLPAALHLAVDAAAASAVHPRLETVDKWTRCQWQYHPLVLLPATSEGADAFKRFEPWTLSDEEVWIEKERVDAALIVIDKAGPSGEAGAGLLLAAWQAYSRTPSDRKRHGDKALDLLAREGAAARSAVPALINGLSWYDTPVLAKAFVKIGDGAVPELAKALDNAELQDLWPAVLMVLQQFGPRAEPAAGAMVKLLSARDETVAQLAAATLGSAGAGAKEAVPELQRLLNSPVSDTRRHAADALGLIGAPAKAALPDLIALFKDDNQQLRLIAVRAVSRLGKDAVEPLTKTLADSNERVRLSAVQALTRMDREAGPALPALRQLDRDDQPAAVREAAHELVLRLEMK